MVSFQFVNYFNTNHSFNTINHNRNNYENIKFTNYSFDNNGKLIASKITSKSISVSLNNNNKIKKPRKIKNTLVTIPKTATQPIYQPLTLPPLFDLIQQYQIDLQILERYHNYKVCEEFCENVRKILYNRLQPNFSKFGFWLFLGTCRHNIIYTLFSSQKCLIWDAKQKSIEDGFIKYYPRKIYLFNKIMPNLGNQTWFIREHGYSKNYVKQLRSFYTELVFIVNINDNRIYCHYKQITQAKGVTYWYDTA
ncbi:hypothetical protein ABK040_008647 [Willaertia magna]